MLILQLGNIKKDVEILGITGNYEGPDLNSVLTEQDQKLAQLEAALANKTASGGKPNIFLQDTEPTKKQGIWLKTTGKEYEKVVAEDTVVEEPSWLPDGTASNIPANRWFNRCVSIGTDIYYFGAQYTSPITLIAYKYNTLTNTYTALAGISSGYNFRDGVLAATDTDIYLFGGYNNDTTAYKYNIASNSYIQIANVPYELQQGSAVTVGTSIYLFAASTMWNNSIAYKYDTLTNKYTKIANIPTAFANNVSTSIGTDIYLMRDTTAYKYDTLTNTYTSLATIPINITSGAIVSTSNNEIYLFSADSTNRFSYIYTISTNSYEQSIDIPYSIFKTSAMYIDSKVYLMGGQEKTKVQVMQFPSSEFEDKSIVLLNGNTYETQLFTSELVDTSVKYPFSDVWLYEESEGGLETDIPTYYGDGTQWVNIKNPVAEEVEE